MKYTKYERLVIMKEVLKVVNGENDYFIQRTRYGNANEVTNYIVDNILAQGVIRTRGALLVQIGACVTGCFVTGAEWNNNSTAKVYENIYKAL